MSDKGPSDEVKQQRKSPSRGFPSMPLDDAANVIRKAGAYGYEQRVGALAQYMGHTTTNSGAFKAKIASLRDFGLIIGRGDTLSLSQLAQTIAHPVDVQAGRDALQEAFFKSDVFAKLHADVAKGVPLDLENIGNTAVRNLGVAAASRQTFIESFVASAVEAGVAERIDDRQIRLVPRGKAASPDAEPVGADSERVREPKPLDQSHEAAPLSPPAALHQAWDLGGGQLMIEIRSDQPIPAAAYAQIAKLVDAAEQLAGLLLADDEQRDEQAPTVETT
jgi:hypothetical protein